jgi:hypothetical protein
MAKDKEYVKSMAEARAKDPEKYDKQKEMYDAAAKKEAEDKDYSPMEAIKKMGKSVLGMKKGGVTRGDGCVKRGHTKGRIV